MTRGVQTDIVDGLSSSTAVKGPCYLATTANVTLGGLQTIDGTVLTDGKRVLVRAQTDATENGIWIASSGNWRRARDFSRNDDVKEGTQVRVTDGATGAGVWVLTSADPIVFETSDIVFSRDDTLTDGALLASNNLGDLDSAIAGWDALARYTGTVSAAAGVLDLSAATAPLLALGAGAITSVTLAAQKLRIARTTAAILITPSATLVVNGGIPTTRGFNIPTGSLVMFFGDTGSVVRVFVLALGSWSKGVAIASAATVTLTPGTTVHVTGVTTITDIDFSPAEDGALAWVVFDGALTLTYHATTLQLPGGASITTAAGDRALFYQDSGDNVICLAYQRADGSPVNVATAANFQANTASKSLDTTGVWGAAASVALTDAATIVVTTSSFINAHVTLGGNRTMGQPTGLTEGKTGRLRIKQDATGSRTLTWHADYEFASGTAPTLSTAANAEDVFYYDILGANRVLITGPIKAVA